MERLENGVVAANECTHGMVKNTQRKQAWHGRGRVCSRYDVGGSMGAGWGPFYLRARRVRRQKQLTLVELTLDTFLMHTCKDSQLSWLPARPLP